MKLFEIAVPNKPAAADMRYKEYQGFLNSKAGGNQKRLGYGVTGVVYKHPQHDTVAVKVGTERHGKIRHQGPLLFYRYCIQHQSNPYVPKIYDVKRYKKGGDEYFVVHLERLRSYNSLPVEEKRKLILAHTGLTDAQIARLQYPHTPDLSGILNNNRERLNMYRDFFVALWPDVIIRGMQKSGKHTPQREQLIELLKFFDRSEFQDNHDGNIMLRGNNQLVFIDPVA